MKSLHKIRSIPNNLRIKRYSNLLPNLLSITTMQKNMIKSLNRVAIKAVYTWTLKALAMNNIPGWGFVFQNLPKEEFFFGQALQFPMFLPPPKKWTILNCHIQLYITILWCILPRSMMIPNQQVPPNIQSDMSISQHY